VAQDAWNAPLIDYESIAQGVVVVTLSRLDAANAVNAEMADLLGDIVRRAEADNSVRVVLLRSAHPKVFCAGADLLVLNGGQQARLFPRDEGFAGFVRVQRTKPWIAVVDGAALAGGVEIVLACDLVVCSPRATFGLPEVSHGLAALAGGLQRLPRRVPPSVALDMALTGEPIDGFRAWQVGLASRIAEPEDLMELALSVAVSISANAPDAVCDSLAVARLALLDGERAAWGVTEEVERRRLNSEAAIEGLRSFAQRRCRRDACKP